MESKPGPSGAIFHQKNRSANFPSSQLCSPKARAGKPVYKPLIQRDLMEYMECQRLFITASETVEKIRRVFGDNLLFLHKNICCGYSVESPCQGDSNEHPQHMFLL